MICPDSPAPLHIPPHSYIDRSAALQRILPDLEKADRLAVDTEADSLHHYFEKVCLMQISSPSRHNYIIDPLAGFDLGPLLNILSAKLLVIHGADYDLRLLRRTFGFSADALYDTSIAAQILGYPAFGLSALMERHFRLAMPKTSQRADWSRRPLTLDMLAYAVNDTAHLLRLADLLEGELRAAGRSAWREQTCRRLIEDAATDREVNHEERWRIRGWRALAGRPLALLRELWKWREDEARKADRPPFKVLGNEALLELAAWADEHPAADPSRFPRAPRNLHGHRLAALRRAIRHALALPERAWPQAPKSTGKRPDPAVAERADRLRKARNALARDMGLDPGVLASNASLVAIAAAAPQTLRELEAAAGLMPWQAQAAGERFLAVLAAPDQPSPSPAPEDESGGGP